MAVREAKNFSDVKIHIRGDAKKLGEIAPRGFLSAVKLDKTISIDPKSSGRLELAQWMTDSSNPLTARVAVNRIWHHLFGRGFVGTVDNFGKTGEKPTHPELLDHLAQRFIKGDWSTKSLVRSIVLSRTYRLGGLHDAAGYAKDPANELLWRSSRRRLDVEALRDAMLAASGKLDLAPPERSRVAEIGNGEVGRGINTKPLEREFLNRSVYMPILRTALPEILALFDFPEPSIVVGRRDVTTVPTQALFFMNNPFGPQTCRGGCPAHDRHRKRQCGPCESSLSIGAGPDTEQDGNGSPCGVRFSDDRKTQDHRNRCKPTRIGRVDGLLSGAIRQCRISLR